MTRPAPEGGKGEDGVVSETLFLDCATDGCSGRVPVNTAPDAVCPSCGVTYHFALNSPENFRISFGEDPTQDPTP